MSRPGMRSTQSTVLWTQGTFFEGRNGRHLRLIHNYMGRPR